MYRRGKAVPAMSRPVTAAPSSIMTATVVGSMPRLMYSQKVMPIACAPCSTDLVATSSEYPSTTKETPSTAHREASSAILLSDRQTLRSLPVQHCLEGHSHNTLAA